LAAFELTRFRINIRGISDIGGNALNQPLKWTTVIQILMSVGTVFVLPVFPQTYGCKALYNLNAGSSVDSLSDGRFLAIATNHRLGVGPFRLVESGKKVEKDTVICIPTEQELANLRRMKRSYEEAVHEAARPTESDVKTSLYQIKSDQPVVVTTWIRDSEKESFGAGQNFKGGKTFKTAAPHKLWVTVASEFKPFCEGVLREHENDENKLVALNTRLEQRLGIPPGYGYERFAELLIRHPVETLQRSCENPSILPKTCSMGPNFQNWTDTKRKKEMEDYPWTGLGYTFDWAKSGDRFEKFGESEFTIEDKASIEVKSVAKTAEYCSAQGINTGH
jgi:hypothetical protein